MTPEQRYKATKTATFVGAASNVILAFMKIIFGWFGNSHALIADGLHSFSDLLTDFLVIIAAKFSHQKADADHPYGHDRIETAATVGLSLFLVIVGLAIIFDAAQHVIHHTTLGEPQVYVVWIALFSVLLNEFIYQYTRKVANRINSDMLHANALHSRSDAAASLVVLIGVIGSLLGFPLLDPIAAIVVGALIIKMGFTLGLRNVNELVDAGVDPNTLEEIRRTIFSVHGVKSIHLLRTRKMAGKILVDVHLIVSPYLSVSEGHHVGDHVLKKLYSNIEHVSDVTVHVDSEDDELYSQCAALPLRDALLPQLAAEWKNIPGANHIKNITLHYLAGKISVEIILPLDLLKSHSAADLEQLYRKCLNSIPALQDIKIRFEI